jgi:hypothetical protein
MKRTHKRSRRSKKNNVTRSIKRTMPKVKKGLKVVGKTAVNVTKEATPIVEKGLGKIYGVLAEGFDMGVRGVKKTMDKKKRTNKRRKN